MALSVIKTELVGFPSPVIQDETSEAGESNFYAPSVYEGSQFSVKLTFLYEDPLLPGTYLLSTAGNCLTDLSNIGVTVTKLSTNEFVLSGIYSGVFQGSKYIFVMRDGSIKELPIGSNEDYRALVEYSPPPSKRNDVQILFDLEFSTASELANITQSVHFSFTNAANILQNLVRSR